MITQNTAPTFAVGDGIVTTQVGSNSRAHDITVQSDGKILVAGFTNISGHNVDVIIRYNSNGSLDTTFDGDGIVTTQVGSGSGAIGVTMQADGKILVAGFTKTSNTSVDSAFALTRYNSNGSLDTTFDENGGVITQVGRSSTADSVTVQTDGKILVAGSSVGGGYLVRYNSNGSLDFTFDSDGIVTVGSYASGVTVQTDGKILVAGSSVGGGYLVRYNSNGSLDFTFDSDGIVTVGSYASGVTVQADGKILVAGSKVNGTSSGYLNRYNTNGSLDTTFDSDGIVTVGLYANSGVTVQADGKILVAGSTNTTSGYSAFAFTRYNSNGSLDSTFSGNGIVTTKVGLGSYASGVTVQSDGKILVAGDSETIFGDMQFTLIRYNSNGNLDAAVPNSFPTGTVTITGTSTQGQTLTASNSLADADGLGAISYQWLNNGNVIPGATQPTYTLTSADAGKTISVKASYTDLQGTSENVSSESTTVVISTKPSKGNDLLTGTVNNDKISALAGNDTLRGGLGSDKLAGGKGADTFTFTSIENSGITSKTRDTITDFKHSEGDQIDLAGLGFTEFIGTQAFRTTNATGQLRFDAKAHILYGSTNADNQPEFSTLLSGVKILVADDFVL